MYKEKKQKNYLLALLILIFFFSGYRALFSQFLTDEEKQGSDQNTRKTKITKDVKSLPPYIARNIKAMIVRNVKGAVRITWDAHPDFFDDFLIGRTTELPYTKERVLDATFVKELNSSAENEVLDTGLRPGKYYYLVLSKDKVKDREIELYPDVNYTSNPVIIEKEATSTSYDVPPGQVTLIYAMQLNDSQVVLTWKGVDAPNVIYSIYRGATPLNSSGKIKSAAKIADINDGSESFVDKGISKTGTYYYAVTTKSPSGAEDLDLVPDQSYTASGLFIALDDKNVVSNLSGQFMSDGSVRLNWSGSERVSGKCLIYRSNTQISNSERLDSAKLIGETQSGENGFTDSNPSKESSYYAVLIKLDSGKIDKVFIEGGNFTKHPIEAGEPLIIKRIAAKSSKGKIIIKWKFAGSVPASDYQMLRAKKMIKSFNDIEGSDIVGRVDVKEKSYIDENPPDGKLYYALIPVAYKGIKDFQLKRGVNTTGNPVYASGSKSADRSTDIDNEIPDSGDVDNVLKHYFFKAKYYSTIKRLDKILKQSDNDYEKAKARLFIGRSWVELGKYKRALAYLLLPDVNKYFPEESRFWKDYSFSHIK